MNAVDASARTISVRLDAADFSITCEDDGHGITSKDMELLGQPWSTSKCHTLLDLDNMSQACTFGFRGQAVASISQVSFLEVVTRARGAPLSWSKQFRGGNVLHCSPLVAVQQSAAHNGNHHHHAHTGTAVYVRDLFYNTPVRRKRLNPKKEMNDARDRIRRIAMMHPGIAFTLIDENSGKTILRVSRREPVVFHLCCGLKESFEACYGVAGHWKLEETTLSWRGRDGLGARVDIHAVASPLGRGAKSKDMQWLYVNHRYVRSQQVGKLMNSLLATTTHWQQQQGGGGGGGRGGGGGGGGAREREWTTRETTARSIWPVYVLHLQLQADQYDVLSEPDKTTVVCHDWEHILDGLRKMFEVVEGNQHETRKEEDETEVEERRRKEIVVENTMSASGTSRSSFQPRLLPRSPATSPIQPPVPLPLHRGRKRPTGFSSTTTSSTTTAAGDDVFSAYALTSSSSSSSSSSWVPALPPPKKSRRTIADMMNRYRATQITAPKKGDRVQALSSSIRELPRRKEAEHVTGVMVVEKENERSIFSGRDQVHRQDAAKIGDPTFQNDQIDVAMGTDATSMHGGTVALTVEMLSSCKLVGQSDKKFLFLIAQDGTMLCVDQHAADERVQLEEFENKFENRTSPNVLDSYLVDVWIPLRPLEEENIEEYSNELLRWNFDVEVAEEEEETTADAAVATTTTSTNSATTDVGTNHETGAASLLSMFSAVPSSSSSRLSLHVKSLPTLFGIHLTIGDMRAFLQELVDASGAIHPNSDARRPRFVTRCLNSLACKRAIKFGDALDRSACLELVRRLSKTRLPFQCAHGRPTVVPIALGNVSLGVCHEWIR